MLTRLEAQGLLAQKCRSGLTGVRPGNSPSPEIHGDSSRAKVARQGGLIATDDPQLNPKAACQGDGLGLGQSFELRLMRPCRRENGLEVLPGGRPRLLAHDVILPASATERKCRSVRPAPVLRASAQYRGADIVRLTIVGATPQEEPIAAVQPVSD
jgi:hypothetical protein